jgi:hypothetical protein
MLLNIDNWNGSTPTLAPQLVVGATIRVGTNNGKWGDSLNGSGMLMNKCWVGPTPAYVRMLHHQKVLKLLEAVLWRLAIEIMIIPSLVHLWLAVYLTWEINDVNASGIP